MHALRLGLQGVQLLSTGRISLPVPEPDRTTLREIRAGRVPLPEVLAAVDDVERHLQRLATTSSVPAEPDRDWVDGWLHRSYVAFWDDGAGVPST